VHLAGVKVAKEARISKVYWTNIIADKVKFFSVTETTTTTA
jgi:hypothetical protein